MPSFCLFNVASKNIYICSSNYISLGQHRLRVFLSSSVGTGTLPDKVTPDDQGPEVGMTMMTREPSSYPQSTCNISKK